MRSEKNIEAIERLGKKIKLDLFKKFCLVKEGHPGSVLSIFDITNVLYEGGYINISKDNNMNDTFIMSKGHAAAVQYPFLVRRNIISEKDWERWGSGDSILRIFGNKEIPGIDVTSGSLGHGIGIACGMALADKLDNIQRNIFVVVSEGELYEGSTWESLLFLNHHNLTAVKIILDVNRNMILGRPEDSIKLEDISKKFVSFGLAVKRFDGHDYKQIFDSLDFLVEDGMGPRAIIADTVKGKGISFMEDKAESHYWAGITEDQMKVIIKELS